MTITENIQIIINRFELLASGTISEEYLLIDVVDAFEKLKAQLFLQPSAELRMFYNHSTRLLKRINRKGVDKINVVGSIANSEVYDVTEVDGISIVDILSGEIKKYEIELLSIQTILSNNRNLNLEERKILLTIPENQVAILAKIIWDAGIVSSAINQTELFQFISDSIKVPRSTSPSKNKISQTFSKPTPKNLALFESEVWTKMQEAFRNLKKSEI